MGTFSKQKNRLINRTNFLHHQFFIVIHSTFVFRFPFYGKTLLPDDHRRCLVLLTEGSVVLKVRTEIRVSKDKIL